MGAEDVGIMLSAERLGIDVEPVNAKTLLFTSEFHGECEVYINRCKSANRRLKLAELFEKTSNPIINPYPTEKICNDKSLTTLLFNKNNIPTPKTCYAPYNSFVDNGGTPVFRRDEVLEVANQIIDHLNFPIVVKPVLGGWGKRVRLINDEDKLVEELINNLATLDNSTGIYVQEYVPKAFDVRSHVVVKNGVGRCVASIARVSPDDERFVTNTAQGGLAVGIDIPQRLEELCSRIAGVVAEGRSAALIALDLMPVMDDAGERGEIYEFHRRLYPYFKRVWGVRKGFFQNVALTKERVVAAEEHLRRAYGEFKAEKAYGELRGAVDDHLEEKTILSQEANSNPDFWFNIRNVAGVDMAEHYLDCVASMVER
jgi:[lysine-biosynthesis-protein LysW]--L-2-aminoadipate ligase